MVRGMIVGTIVLVFVNAVTLQKRGWATNPHAQPPVGFTARLGSTPQSAPYLVSQQQPQPQPLGLPSVAIVFSQETPLLVATGAGRSRTLVLVIAIVHLDPWDC